MRVISQKTVYRRALRRAQQYSISAVQDARRKDEKLEHYRVKRPPSLPSDLVEVSEKPHTRVLRLDWTAFEEPAEKVVLPLRAWLQAWQKNRVVRCVCFYGKYGTFKAGSIESIDAIYDLYQAIGVLSPACPQPESIRKPKPKQPNTRRPQSNRGGGGGGGRGRGNLPEAILLPPKPTKSQGPTAALGLVSNSIITVGGLGLLPPKLSVATNDVLFVSPMDPESREHLPRYIDGGIGYRLAQGDCYGRAAALAGLDVTGVNLSRANIVSHVVTYNIFESLLDETIAPTAIQELENIFEILEDDLDAAALMADHLLNHGLDDDREHFKHFAEQFFTTDDLEESIHLLRASAHENPLAAAALKNISLRPVDASILATLLKRSTSIDFTAAIHLERHLAKELFSLQLNQDASLTQNDVPFIFDNIPPPPTQSTPISSNNSSSSSSASSSMIIQG